MYIKALYEYFKACNYTVSTDSRNCTEGSLFFALKGDSFDGNKYAIDALKNGAAYVVVDNAEVIEDNSDKYILVHDTLLSLQLMANYHRQLLEIPVIGITGTNGKTTTKELIAAVLEKKYKTQYTKGNFNNHIGVPLTLLGIKPEHEIAVIEMGANHMGEIKDLARITQPDFGIITNVGKAHLEGFGSFENVIATKSELYDFIRSKKGGAAFLNNDDSILTKQAEGINKLFTYGQTEQSDICGHIKVGGITLSVSWHERNNAEKEYLIDTQLVGDYNLYNVLSAITIGVYFKVPINDINAALAEYVPSNNRSQLVNTKKNLLIVDAYNANPTSMIASLKNFCSINASHKMVILGDMRELGVNSKKEHQAIIQFLEEQEEIESILLVGEEFGKTTHHFKHFSNKDALVAELKLNPLSDKTILIKGSNGIQLSKITDVL